MYSRQYKCFSVKISGQSFQMLLPVETWYYYWHSYSYLWRTQTLEQVKEPKMRYSKTLNYNVYSFFKFVGITLYTLYVLISLEGNTCTCTWLIHLSFKKNSVCYCAYVSYSETEAGKFLVSGVKASLGNIETLSLKGRKTKVGLKFRWEFPL